MYDLYLMNMAGHIQSAINVPLETLKESMPKLPKDQKLLFIAVETMC